MTAGGRRHASRPQSSGRRGIPPAAWALLGIAVLIAGIGGLLIHRGLQEIPRAAPLPAAPFSVPPGQLPPEQMSGGASSVTLAITPGGTHPRPDGSLPPAVPTDAAPGPTGSKGVSGHNESSAPRPQQPAVPLAGDHLVIPAVGVDAPVTAETMVDGALTIPGDVRMVGAWTGSAAMSAVAGTVLLAGHIDNIDQGPGALHDVYLLQPGDKVFLQLHGVSGVWQIVTLGTYPKTAIPASLFDGPTGPRRLALVTCGGQIHNGEYDDNVVATAVPA